MAVSAQLKNQHLLWRAGFGPMAEDSSFIHTSSPKSVVKALIKASSKNPQYLDVADNSVKGLVMGVGDVVNMQRNELNEDQKKQVRQQSREDLKSLNIAWLGEIVNSEAQLREKMALFWHGHFASRNLNIYYQQLLLDIIRTHALGSFGDLLHAVSKSAAMLNFLNNNQNRKDHPNENFAREVMELFTMGRGNYSEQDVKEAARAFTGWGANVDGDFVFRNNLHDAGVKQVLGKSGNFDGDDVLNILLEQKQTAIFITRKIYRFFVNDTPDEQHVASLAASFYQSNYNILALLESIFQSDWFYDEKNIGSRIKSPVELIAGMRRMLPMKLEDESVQLLIQRLLGQLLFYPPNVAGWPGGFNWIDSSSLMLRLQLPGMIVSEDELQMKPKEDDDQTMGMQSRDPALRKRPDGRMKKGSIIKATIDWPAYVKMYDSIPRENLFAGIVSTVLQHRSTYSENMLASYINTNSREDYIKSVTLKLMSTPEYQLC